MEKYPPDTNYIPGYTGYIPQLKYTMGKSYGQLTAELLTSPSMATSNRRVVQREDYTNVVAELPLTTRDIPDSHSKKMIPGYTGFIPKRQNYFACSFTETCHKALSEFYKEQRTKIQKKPPIPRVVKSTNLFDVYKPLNTFVPSGKAYFLDDDDPQKYFISGFTGHVPKSRFLFGKGYPITTKQALIQFGKQRRGVPTREESPDGSEPVIKANTNIYPTNKGVLPSFTGHIPGYKFMYGQTFGQLSQNALEKSGIMKNRLANPKNNLITTGI
ncbi:ciliary microtubule inner protein 2B [Neosynchiropus ocellatus]